MATETTTYLGTGRRKTSTARIRMTDGTGKLEVNGKEIEGRALTVNEARDKPKRESRGGFGGGGGGYGGGGGGGGGGRRGGGGGGRW